MKALYIKSVISVLLIGSFSAWVFYSGWISLRLEEGEYAVIYSRTSGYSENPIKSGEFKWIWQSVIPGNVTLRKFRNNTMNHSFQLTLKLPSADYYSQWLQNKKESFSINLEGHLTYSGTIKDISENLDTLPRDEDLLKSQLDSIISAFILKTYENFDIYGEYPLIPGLKEDLIDEIYFHLPHISIGSLDIISFSFPDKELYELSKKISAERERAINAEAMKKVSHMGNWERTQSEKFELLKEYGEIFRKYPELLDFLKLPNNKDLDIISLEQILPTVSHPADSQELTVPVSD